jgi:putative transposase
LSSLGADSNKKTLIAAEQEREDVAQKRRDWKQNQNDIDPDHVVFIDETCTQTNMTHTCGRSQRGTRVIEEVPFGR